MLQFRAGCMSLGQPLQIVAPGDRFPQDVVKTLVVVRLSDAGARNPPCVKQVGQPLFEIAASQVFLVNVPAAQEQHARRRLTSCMAPRRTSRGLYRVHH